MSTTFRSRTQTSFRLRKLSEPIRINQTRFLVVRRTKPLIILKSPTEASIKAVTRPCSLVIQTVPTEPKAPAKPFTITRPEKFIIRKVLTKTIAPLKPLAINQPRIQFMRTLPSHLKSPLEPPIRAQLFSSIRRYPSSSPYLIITRATAKFWKTAQPTIAPVENVTLPNRDGETPSERIKRGIASANAKRLHREEWAARTGRTKLAISLLFSPRTQAKIAKLRKKYSPTPWENFNLLFFQLQIDKFTEYNDMLARFAETCKPFVIGLKPGRLVHEEKFKVGLQLESDRLPLLEKDLQEGIKNLHTEFQRYRMMRSDEGLRMMVIRGDIRELKDALRLEEVLRREYEEGIKDLKVEGLVLHGGHGRSDCLFPTPKEFPFSGREAGSQQSAPLAP